MDLPHNEVVGNVESIDVIDNARRAELDFGSEEHQFEGYTTWKFGFSQLLKFADLRKSDLKETDKEGETYVKPDAGEMILEGIDENQLVFKVDQDEERVIAVVSTDYVSLPTEEVVDITRDALTSRGITDFEFHEVPTRSRLVDEVEFRFEDESKELEEVGDVLDGGLYIRNSSFGASSLRVNRYYTILACGNGMLSRRSGSEFRQVHMGDAESLRESLHNEVDAQVEALWDEVDFIEAVHGIEFPLESQLEFLDAISSKITKRSANAMAGRIIHEAGLDLEEYSEEHNEEYENLDIPTTKPNGDQEWNTGEGNVWSLINAFTGYIQHSDLSSESTTTQMERVYNTIMEAEDADDVMAIAGI